MKDKTYNCLDCGKKLIEKAVTPELAKLKMCLRCYDERMTEGNKNDR